MRLLLAILLLLIAAPAQAQQGQGMSKAMVVSSCGGGALPSGALTNLTMDTTGRLCQSGIGSNVCPQAAAYLARTTGGNEGGNAVNITALICGLVTDGIIDGTLTGTTTCGSHLDALYVMAQQNTADAQLNLCGSSYGLTPSTLVFVSYKGYTGNAASTYIITGFNPVTSPSPHLGQNSGNIGVWIYSGIDVGPQMSTGTGFGDINIAGLSGGSFYCYISPAGGGNSVASPGVTGFFGCDRTGSAHTDYYFNGSNVGTSTTASQAVNNAPVALLNNSNTTISEAHMGGSLGATLETALYNRLRTYMTAVGVP